TEKNQQCSRELAENAFIHIEKSNREGVFRVYVTRYLPAKLLQDRLKFSVKLTIVYTGPDSVKHRHKPARVRFQVHGRVDIFIHPGEADGKHAHYRVNIVIQPYLFSQDVASALEYPLPELVADDGDRFRHGINLAIVGGEHATEKWRNAEEIEEVRGAARSPDHFCQAASCHYYLLRID